MVAWTSAVYHGFEWTTETADFRSAVIDISAGQKFRFRRSEASSSVAFGLGVTTLSQLPREHPDGRESTCVDLPDLRFVHIGSLHADDVLERRDSAILLRSLLGPSGAASSRNFHAGT